MYPTYFILRHPFFWCFVIPSYHSIMFWFSAYKVLNTHNDMIHRMEAIKNLLQFKWHVCTKIKISQIFASFHASFYNQDIHFSWKNNWGHVYYQKFLLSGMWTFFFQNAQRGKNIFEKTFKFLFCLAWMPCWNFSLTPCLKSSQRRNWGRIFFRNVGMENAQRGKKVLMWRKIA